MTNINSISCGQGGPSLFLIVMAGEGLYPADVVIVADTGWENDMLWSTGDRTNAQLFFLNVTRPLANRYGIDAYFVRSKQDNGSDYLPIPESVLSKQAVAGTEEHKSEYYGLDIPLFGSNGGRLRQSCTSKWKIQAIRQQLRRLGATTATSAMGLHRDEIHRVKPAKENDWQQLIWPMLDLGTNGNLGIGRTWSRIDVESELNRRNIPYLVTTECDGCPHKDWARWNRTSQQTIEELAAFEATFDGQFFLTPYRKPLKEAIALMENDNTKQLDLFDSCDSGYCFV